MTADELKITPGPWCTARDKKGHYNACECTVIAQKEFDPKCPNIGDYFICSTYYSPALEREANAHLIAAAPDMYALLEYLAEFIENGGNTGEMETINLDCIKSILKKARGEG